MNNELFTGKKILVTGGTGSIGLALVNKLKKTKPDEIRIFSNDEYALFHMREESDPIKLIIGDITNFEGLKSAVRGCDIVFHAAALKHITMCEINPAMAIYTNVIGTQNVIRACMGEAKIFVNISTDKAVNPVSTLGATKLLGEKLTSSINHAKTGTKCWSVRFGNVIGSRGSVYEAFSQQLKDGKNLKLTDKRMTRFIMSIDDAADLILKTCSIAQGGEVFVLKMPIIRIKDLAEVMTEMYSEMNNVPPRKIDEIGMREAEKLYEELMTELEAELSYEADDLFVIQSPFEKHGRYSNYKKTTVKRYRSEDFSPITKDQLRSLLEKYFQQIT